MGYVRRDGIKAFATPEGGFEVRVSIRGRTYSRLIPPHGFVTQAEAAVIVQPPVSRVAVFQWIRSGKLKDDRLNGVSMIRLSRLRRFAAETGRTLVGPAQL
jgi:hypothetical protein